MAPSFIHDYIILYLIIVKGKGTKVFELVKKQTPRLAPLSVLFLMKSKISCFNYYIIIRATEIFRMHC